MTTPIYGRVTCKYCNKTVNASQLRRHHKSRYCEVAQERLNVGPEWEMLTYELHSKYYELTNHWLFNKDDFQYHIKSVPWSYRRPGWGKPGSVRSINFIRHEIATIIQSPSLTKEEKLYCLHVPHDDSQARALYATAALST